MTHLGGTDTPQLLDNLQWRMQSSRLNQEPANGWEMGTAM